MKIKKLWIAALCIISISAIRICIADGDGWYKSLMDAADVDRTPPADGEALIWDDTAQLWEAGDVGTVSDTAYGASWNGTTTVAPSKNAVYDKIEAASGDVTAVGDCLTGACFEGTTGTNLTFKGATSGTTILKPTAIAGTTTITLPAETGTVCTTGSVCSGYQASGAVTSVTGTAPIVSSGGATPAISIPVATSSANGYLASTDWTTFNNKVATSRYINTTSPLSGGGDLSADRTIAIPQGNSTTDGYINATDWTTFNNKLNTTLASANIYVGNATNVTAAVAMSGDATMSNAGALAINDDSHSHTSTTLPATVTYLGTAIDETEMSLSDITTLNSNTTRHGFLPKLSGTATEFVNGAGSWATPAGSGMQYTDTRYKVVTFSRDVSLASGTQAITGVGFQGKAMELFMYKDGGFQASWGKTDGTTTSCGPIYLTAGTFTGGGSDISRWYDSGGSMTTVFTSFDADGFTLTHTKTTAPIGTANYIAIVYR